MYHQLALENQTIFTRVFFEGLKGSGLSSGQPKILEYLFENDGAFQKEIALACFIEPATVTSLLARMESSGLIYRATQKNNRKYLHVFLTDKGREAHEQVKLAFEQAEQIVFEGFSEAEVSTFLKMQHRINQNLKECMDSE